MNNNYKLSLLGTLAFCVIIVALNYAFKLDEGKDMPANGKTLGL